MSAAVTTQLRKEGTKVSEETNHLITWNLFTTITNANFDNEAIIARIHNTLSVRRTLILQVKDTSGLPEAAFWDIKTKDGSDASDDVLFAKAKEAGVLSTKDEDIRSLRELITYGLKGLSLQHWMIPSQPMTWSHSHWKPETMVSEAWRCSILQIPVPMAILKLPE